MNWKDCVSQVEYFGLGDRFTWPPDLRGFDCKPDAFTISDAWGAIAWVWTLPGDWLLSQEPLKTFFEIEGTTAVGTTGSVILGFPILFVILAIWLAISNISDSMNGPPR
jgi:hypothetical protein